MSATTMHGAAAVPSRSPILLGLGNLLRKDASEWLHGKRPWMVLGITAAVFVLSAANSAIGQWVIANLPADAGDGPAKPFVLVPLDNLLMAVGSQFSAIVAIFATMSLIVAERDTGTLAWTISKPVSRTSVLASKWLTASLFIWLLAIVVPIALTTVAVAALYGVPDLGVVLRLTVLLATVPAIYVAITIAAGTFVGSPAAVATIAFAFFAVPAVVGGIVPALGDFFPTSIFGWAIAVSTGAPVSLVTPVVWAAGIAVLFALGGRRLNHTDL